jgi:hypothetical protein
MIASAPTGHIAVAEAHARACFDALERHCAGHQLPRCGCYRQPEQAHMVISDSCDIGQVLREEYEIASRRVRELREASRVYALDQPTSECPPKTRSNS